MKLNVCFHSCRATYENEMYCQHVTHADISKCRYGYEVDSCNKSRCLLGPDEECEKFPFGKRCADKLRCSCNFCQGCIGAVCSIRTCDSQSKRVPSKIRTIAELLRQQEQQQQLQQQLQFEQEEQRQLQDLLQRQSERHPIPLALQNDLNNNGKSILFDRIAPYYPFNNNSNEIIFSN